MTRFKKPSFLKAFDRPHENDTSNLLANASCDFFAEVYLPSFKIETEELEDKEKIDNTVYETKTISDTCPTTEAVHSFPVTETSKIADETAESTSPCEPFTSSKFYAYQTQQSGLVGRSELRRCSSERVLGVDCQRPNNQESNTGLTCSTFHNSKKSCFMYVDTSLDICKFNSKEASVSIKNQFANLDMEKQAVSGSLLLLLSTTSEIESDNKCSNLIEEGSSSSHSSCTRLTRAAITKEQIALSTSLKISSFDEVPDMIHQKGINSTIADTQYHKKKSGGISRLMNRIKKDEEQEIKKSRLDEELEAKMIRVSYGEDADTFAQFCIGLKGESQRPDIFTVDNQHLKSCSNECIEAAPKKDETTNSDVDSDNRFLEKPLSITSKSERKMSPTKERRKKHRDENRSSNSSKLSGSVMQPMFAVQNSIDAKVACQQQCKPTKHKKCTQVQRHDYETIPVAERIEQKQKSYPKCDASIPTIVAEMHGSEYEGEHIGILDQKKKTSSKKSSASTKIKQTSKSDDLQRLKADDTHICDSPHQGNSKHRSPSFSSTMTSSTQSEEDLLQRSPNVKVPSPSRTGPMTNNKKNLLKSQRMPSQKPTRRLSSMDEKEEHNCFQNNVNTSDLVSKAQAKNASPKRLTLTSHLLRAGKSTRKLKVDDTSNVIPTNDVTHFQDSDKALISIESPKNLTENTVQHNKRERQDRPLVGSGIGILPNEKRSIVRAASERNLGSGCYEHDTNRHQEQVTGNRNRPPAQSVLVNSRTNSLRHILHQIAPHEKASIVHGDSLDIDSIAVLGEMTTKSEVSPQYRKPAKQVKGAYTNSCKDAKNESNRITIRHEKTISPPSHRRQPQDEKSLLLIPKVTCTILEEDYQHCMSDGTEGQQLHIKEKKTIRLDEMQAHLTKLPHRKPLELKGTNERNFLSSPLKSDPVKKAQCSNLVLRNEDAIPKTRSILVKEVCSSDKGVSKIELKRSLTRIKELEVLIRQAESRVDGLTKILGKN